MNKQKLIEWLNNQAFKILEDAATNEMSIEYLKGQIMTYVIVAQEICMGKFDDKGGE